MDATSQLNLPLLVTPFGQDLRELAFACDDLRSLSSRDQICTQVEASCSPFGHPTQVNGTTGYVYLEMGFFGTCKKTCESVWPPNAIT